MDSMKLEDLSEVESNYAGNWMIQQLIEMTESGRLAWEKTTLNVFCAELDGWKFDFVAAGNHYLVISNAEDDYCLLTSENHSSLPQLFKALYLQLERTKMTDRPQPPRQELFKMVDKNQLIVSIEAKRRWNLMEKLKANLL